MSDLRTLPALFKPAVELHALLYTLDTLYGDVHRSGGIEERLQAVTAHTNDRDSSIAEVNEEKRKLRKEVELTKSYIIRLERRLDSKHVSVNSHRLHGILTQYPEDYTDL